MKTIITLWRYVSELNCLSLVAKCDRLVATPNSILSGCGGGSLHNVFGDKCLLYCVRGYRRENGSTERICQANGTWSGEKLHCQGGARNMNGDYLPHFKCYYMGVTGILFSRSLFWSWCLPKCWRMFKTRKLDSQKVDNLLHNEHSL